MKRTAAVVLACILQAQIAAAAPDAKPLRFDDTPIVVLRSSAEEPYLTRLRETYKLADVVAGAERDPHPGARPGAGDAEALSVASLSDTKAGTYFDPSARSRRRCFRKRGHSGATPSRTRWRCSTRRRAI